MVLKLVRSLNAITLKVCAIQVHANECIARVHLPIMVAMLVTSGIAFGVATNLHGTCAAQEHSEEGYKIQYHRGLPIVHANICGRMFRCLLHTSAPMCSFDYRVLEAASPGEDYEVVNRVDAEGAIGVRGLEISVGNLSSDRFDLAEVLELSGSESPYSEIDGILGRDVS